MSPQPATVRLAILDDDSGFLRVLTKRIEAAGWEYRILGGHAPADELAAMKLSAVLIDPRLLGTEAWGFIERVAGLLPGLGVIVCAQEASVAQRVRGLRLGADDWIAKPCHPEEVIARIEAVVRRRRRSEPRADTGPLVAGELEIRTDQYQAFVGGRSVDLTRREFELLQILTDAAGKVLEREDIYRRVWGYEMAHGDRSVDVFVRKVRSKVQRHSPGWDYIHTHFGVGYRFEPVALDDPNAAQSATAPESEITATAPEPAEDLELDPS